GPVRLCFERADRVVGGVRSLERGLVAGQPRELVESLVELSAALAVGPPDDGVYAAARPGGRVQERRQPLLGGDRPEVAALDPALVELAGGRESPRDLDRALPSARRAKRGPRLGLAA